MVNNTRLIGRLPLSELVHVQLSEWCLVSEDSSIDGTITAIVPTVRDCTFLFLH